LGRLFEQIRNGEKFQSSGGRGINGMAISVDSSVIALVGTGWKSVAGQLLASGVLLLSGYQDIGLRARMGAVFGFFMAIAFGISALVTAIRANLSYAAVTCVVVLCSETLLILRWWLRRTSA
jgi:Ca2+/Na+ antiporter